MKRLIYLLLNPFSLSLWVVLIIACLFPFRIDKYISGISEKGEYLNDHRVIYNDLDGDGSSEKIAFFHNSLGIAALTISNKYGIMDQWTLKGRYDFTTSRGIIIIGDSEGNGINEIYAFTLVNDSVFLFVISDYRIKVQHIDNYFVSLVGLKNGKADPYIVEAEMDDLDQDGNKELIFGIGTGYSRFPRSVFAFNTVTYNLKVSESTGYFMLNIIQDDINGDGFREIIPGGYAAGNISDTSVAYPDSCSWLIVFNKDLAFEFDPVQFPGEFSDLMPAVITGKNGNPVLTALYCPPEKLAQSSLLLAFDLKGEVTRTQPVGSNATDAISLKDYAGKRRLLVGLKGEGIKMYDSSFKILAEYSYDYDGSLSCSDIDQDGLQEIINTDLLSRRLIILQNDLKHPVTIGIEGRNEKGVLYSIIKDSGKSAGLYVQLGSYYGVYTYGINTLYNYRWLLYAAIYFSVLSFILIVRKIQSDQIRRKNETTRKITDLQLQILRNQLDPHFIMNAVNSIIDGLNDHEKEDVKKQLLHFSLLHRSLLITSDQIGRSLQDEIDFTRNYLALEKFRYRNKFTYDFDIDPSVDLFWEVPKMIIQIYVENALKHGIFHIEKDGYVIIKIKGESHKIIIEITDNGAGRAYSKGRSNSSTGKGTLLMQQYSNLLNQSNSEKIQIETVDLYNAEGLSAGTKVRIEIGTDDFNKS